jgi:hypothetical protein
MGATKNKSHSLWNVGNKMMPSQQVGKGYTLSVSVHTVCESIHYLWEYTHGERTLNSLQWGYLLEWQSQRSRWGWILFM